MVLSTNTGNDVLNVIGKANEFNKWMYETIRPYINGNILEIGSGTGNISSFFVEAGDSITLSDIDDNNIDTLRTKFANALNIKGVYSIDLEKKDFASVYHGFNAKYDSVFLLNVLEHIKNDTLAINNCMYLLKPGGKLVILVPSYSWLYSQLDKELGHYRRYTTKRLQRLITNEGMKLKASFYFNSMGIPAWLCAKLRRLKRIPEAEMGTFNKMVKIGKQMDTLLFKKLGLSTIVVCEK